MLKMIQIIVLATLCLNFSAKAQETPLIITPLKIGDQVPEEIWKVPLQAVNHPQKKEVISLSDYKDKLLILDFWSTYCGPCIKSLPDFQKLQRKFNGELQIILTTPEDRKIIPGFLKSRNIDLFSLVEENQLAKVFPHNTVPHEVWIRNGKVLAITHSNEVTEENIKKVLDGANLNLPEKKSIPYDISKPLLVDGNGGTGNNLLVHSILTKYIDGISGGGGVSIDSLNRCKILAIGASIVGLYQAAVQRINYDLNHQNRLLLDLKDKDLDRYRYDRIPEYDPSIRGDFYCYELIIATPDKQRAGEYMLEDLNRYFGALYHIKGGIEKRKVMCWVLKKKDPVQVLISKGGTPDIILKNGYEILINQPFEKFFSTMAFLNREQPFPFVDQTGIKNEVDIDLPLSENDLPALKKSLLKYGLVLTREECELEMLVLKDIK